MTVTIEYAEISPAVLDLEVRNAVCNAVCLWREVDEDHFEFEVIGWLPLTPGELARIEKVLAPYV